MFNGRERPMPGGLVERTLREELVQTFHDPAYKPPSLPSVAIMLSRITRSDETSVGDVVRVLEQDQMLAGSVLRLVSSPLYASRSPVTSLHQAVVRLGLKRLRSVVFEAALRGGIFNLPEYQETVEQVRRHSTTTAYIAKLVCEASGVDEDDGFICGLLHDVGFSALMLSVSHVEKGDSPRLDALWGDIERMHERASSLVARLWELPSEICETVGHHHDPARCSDDRAAKVAAAVCIGDWLTERFGANVVGPRDPNGKVVAADQVSEAGLAHARRILGVDDAKLETLVERAEEIVPEILWV
jgi:HD-like signal output (HDOD) protein